MKKENDSGIELTVNGNTVEVNGDREVRKENKGIHLRVIEVLRNFINFFTVEPYLLCYVLPNVISAVAVQKLNIDKACRSDLNQTQVVCDSIIEGDEDDNITMEISDATQIIVANMIAWKQPLQSGIPAIMILFVGAWSDRTGNRKALMLLPIVGEFISSLGLIMATYYFTEWPLWVTGLIEALPSALSGGISIALMGAYSYIADVTTVESRTFRLGLVGIIVTLGIPLGSSISGILTETIGYYGIFGLNLVFFAVGFFHTLYRIHDVRKTESEGTMCEKIILFFHVRHIWDTISLVIMTRGRQFVQILLIICAHIVIIGPAFGESALLFLYLLYEFDLSIYNFSFFTTYTTLTGLFGTTIALTIFSKKLKMHDAMLGIIATTCKVASSFVYALAPNRSWLLAAPLFDIFGGSGVVAIRSLGTKVVNPDQVGKMCSLIGFVEAIVPVIYTPMYTTLYTKTLDTFPGAFYMLGGVMTVPAFFIFITLYVLHRKQQRDVVTDPDAKETYAQENDVTAL